MEKYISIINTVQASAADCVVSGNTVSITGLKPFSTNNLLSFKVNKFIFPTGMKYVSTAVSVTTGDFIKVSVTQTVDGLVKTSSFDYSVTASSSVAAVNTALSAWVVASGFNFATYTATGASLAALVFTFVASTSNVSFEVGGTFTSSVGVVSSIPFVYTAPTSLTGISATSITLGTEITFTSAAHGLKNGQVVTIGGFAGGAAAYNGGIFRVKWLSANTFALVKMDGYAVDGTSAVSGGSAGTLSLLASEEYGTSTQVNNEASAVGSSQTATVSANYYSCIAIQGTYPNTAMGALVQPQLFEANVWYSATPTTGATALSADVIALEDALDALIM